MSKTKTQPKKSVLGNSGQQESPAIEALTVGWALAVMTTFMCDVGAAVTRILVGIYGDPTTKSLESMAILSGLLLFAAVVAGVVSLALLPAVLLMRRQRPPVSLVVFSVVAAVAPLAAAVAMQVLN